MRTDVAKLVQSDIEARASLGERKYGERLQTHNGRCGLQDAYEEALDLCMYLRQVIEECADTKEALATSTNTTKVETGKPALCEGMPHGSCKGVTMCNDANVCFRPA